MFYLLRKSHILQLLVGVSVLIFCGVEIFIKPLDISCFSHSFPCADSLAQRMFLHPTGMRFFALLLLLLQSVLMLNYIRRSGFLDEENVLSILFFCAISAGMGVFLPLSPIWITNTAILAVLNLINRFSTSSSKTSLLCAGMIIGAASLFDPAVALFLVFFLVYILFNQIDKLRAMLATLCGVLVPYLYLFAHHYFAGTLSQYWQSFSEIRLNFPLITQHHPSIIALVAMGVGLLLIIYVIARLRVLYQNKLIVIRRRYLYLCILFVFNLAMMFTTNVPYPYSLSYLLIPITVFIIAFIPVRDFSISSEILLVLLVASFVVMGRL